MVTYEVQPQSSLTLCSNIVLQQWCLSSASSNQVRYGGLRAIRYWTGMVVYACNSSHSVDGGRTMMVQGSRTLEQKALPQQKKAKKRD